MVLSRVRVAGLGAKTFIQGHERRTAGRCDLFGGQLMLTGLQADIGIQRGWDISAYTGIPRP